MKKRRHVRRGLMITNCLSIAAMVVCVVMLAFESKMNGLSLSYMLLDNARADIYEDTDIFTSRFINCIDDAIRLVVIRDQFETDGTFDGDKEIDIKKYATHKEPSRYETASVTYYLDDLIRWGRMGYSTTSITSEEYYETYHKAEESVGSAESLVTSTGTAVVAYEPDGSVIVRESSEQDVAITEEDSSGSVSVFDQKYTLAVEKNDEDTLYNVIYEESYYPTNGDYLILHTNSPAQYETLSDYLITSLEMAYYNYCDYQLLQEELGMRSTNFYYYVAFSDKGEWKTFSNLSNQKYNQDVTEGDIDQLFLSLGRYIKCNYDNLTSVTNINMNADEVWTRMMNYHYAYPSNVRMWFGVDTDYPMQDIFQNDKETLFSSFNIYKRTFVAGVLFALLAIVCLIALCVVEKADSTRGKRVDKLKTEIAFATGCLLVFLLTLGYSIIFKTIYRHMPTLTLFKWRFPSIIGIAATGIYGILLGMTSLVFLMSFVRRIKRHTLYGNSLMIKLIDALSYTVYHPKAVIRTWIPYTLCIFVNVILVYLVCERHAAYMIALIIFDLSVGVILLRSNQMKLKVMEGVEKISQGDFEYKLNADEMTGDNKVLAMAMNSIGDDVRNAVMSSMKDERMKVDLITNVSHDIKTPLTSIINYIDLIKRENIDNENVRGYIKVLDSKSQRLKQLTDDLVEASKISSGNISLDMQPIDIGQMVLMSEGEFDEKFEERNLEAVITIPEEPVMILADSRRIWRVIENLYSNIVKYAMENTRVYIDLTVEDETAVLAIKNISNQKLNIDAKELTERFIRGDISRSTEGSGLGLSIARSLTELQGGKFDIYLDGDLFKVLIKFPIDKTDASEYNSDINEASTIETKSQEENE